MGIPERQLPSQQRFLLEEAVGKVMARKVAIGKCRKSEEVWREEQRGQHSEGENNGKSRFFGRDSSVPSLMRVAHRSFAGRSVEMDTCSQPKEGMEPSIDTVLAPGWIQA